MANRLKMEKIEAIKALLRRGWSERRISRELGVHRATVKQYNLVEEGSNCTIPRTGNEGADGANRTISRTGKSGRQSKCALFGDHIKEKFERGLSAERIHRDLVIESGFEGSYDSVQRFVKKLKEKDPRRVWRMEVEPGEEAQVDYGTMRILDEGGRRLKQVHLLRVILSHSRKGFTEAVRRQTTESFIRSLENAFRHFGGAPASLCIDNLRAAVTKADWYEPEINPKIRSFAEHYQTVVLPTRPHTPEHKGKVEAGVKYVKSNALKGRTFESLGAINEHLRWWEKNVADCRIHGTTKKQVAPYFEAVEKSALKPLAPGLFPCYEEGQRRVHRDGFVEVKGAYYDVPEEYIGRQVWVRWEAAMVRLFNQQMEPIGSHRRLQPGQFTRTLGREGARGSVAQSTAYFRRKVTRLGNCCGRWADSVIASQPAMAIRKMQGLLSLSGKYRNQQIEQACAEALLHGDFSLKGIKHRLSGLQHQSSFTFLKEHELIREMEAYGQIAGDFSD